MITGLPLDRRVELAARFMGSAPYDYQIEYIRAHNDPTIRLDLWNKARQTGLSTVAVADMAVEALVSPDYVGLLVSTKQDKANRLLGRLKAGYLRMGPQVYREIVARENESHVRLTSGGCVYTLSGAPRDAREFTADQITLDEFAHVAEQEALLTAITPAGIRKGRTTIISTPNGPGDVFHTWATNPGKFGVHYFEVPWERCPALTPEYMKDERDRLRAMGRSFEQEYCCSFEQTSASIFPWDLLTTALVEQPMTTRGRYLLGWDPARDRDSSGVVVLRLEGDRQEVVDAEDLAGIPYNEQLRRVVDISLRWGVSRRYIDSWGQGDPVADFLGHGPDVVRCKMTKDHNRAAAAYVKVQLERGKFTIAPDVDLGRDILKALNAFDNRKGLWPYATHQGHADLGMALFLAWQGVPRQKRRAARDITSMVRGSARGRPQRPGARRW